MDRYTLEPDSDLLLIVDLQNDFCPGGALPVPEGDQVVRPINALAGRFVNIAATQDWHPAGHRSFASSHPGRRPFETIELDYGPQVLWPDHCVQGTRGAAFHPDIALNGAQVVVRKGFHRDIDSYSAFCENDQRTATGLAGYLRERGIRRLFLAGLAYDFCVLWSALDARKQGFEVVVIEDACRAIDLEGSASAATEAMRAAGVGLTSGDRIG
jgi:nicotinamidase/pyrazinamidase